MADEIVKHVSSKTDAQVVAEYTGTEGRQTVYFPTDAYRIYATGKMMASRYEADLLWGGKNFANDYGVIDAALYPRLGTNRSMFMPGSSITVEYSTDGGTTWVDYGATDNEKAQLFCGEGGNFYIGKGATSSGTYQNFQLRVIVNTASKLYTNLNKFILYVSTNGSTGSWCSILARLQSDVNNNNNKWTTFADQVPIAGFSGYSVINTNYFRTYGSSQPTTTYGQVMFLFGCTGKNSTYASYGALRIYSINCFGGMGWTTPSNMAKTGHLYSWDYAQNAIFPALVNSTGFKKSNSSDNYVLLGGGGHAAISDLSVNYATSAGDATTVNGKTVEKNVPNNAVFTDTKVTQTVTSSANSSTRPLLIGDSYSDASTFEPATTTASAYATHLAKFAPSTGILSLVGLTKMKTDGTMDTASDTKVWNTNGGVTDISGKQDKVAAKGSATKPLYTSADGTFAECTKYAGGTLVALNGTSKGGAGISIYAPTGGGTSGQFLKSNGASSAPTYETVKELTDIKTTDTPASPSRVLQNCKIGSSELSIYDCISTVDSNGKLNHVTGKAVYILDARLMTRSGQSIPVSCKRYSGTPSASAHWKITIPSDFTGSISNAYCYVKFVYDASASGSAVNT